MLEKLIWHSSDTLINIHAGSLKTPEVWASSTCLSTFTFASGFHAVKADEMI